MYISVHNNNVSFAVAFIFPWQNKSSLQLATPHNLTSRFYEYTIIIIILLYTIILLSMVFPILLS